MDDMQTLVAEARRLSGLIDSGVQALRQAAVEVAEAEHAYRLAKARAWHEVSDGLAGQKQADVDAACADARRTRDVAEATRQAALEALRSRRSQLDALRSILSASRSEMELAR